MARSTEKTRACDTAARAARLAKAEEFLAAAETIGVESPDAYVSMCVLAGVAAADVICCAKLGVHAAGDDHAQAVDLLSKADRPLAKRLSQLLSMKSKSAYSDMRSNLSACNLANRSASALLAGARAG